MTRARANDVVIVGAGAVGVAVARELAARGASVTVLERGPAPASGCSAGNAGVVGASHVLPLATMQAVREGLTCLVRPGGAFALSPRPQALPWLARFVAAARPARAAAAERVLERLAGESAVLHRELGARLDVGYAERGFLSVYDTPAAFAAASAGERRRDGASAARILDGAAARARCPQLLRAPAGAILVPGDAHCDPRRFVEALADEARALGAEIRTGVEVLGVRRRDGSLRALWTTSGELRARRVVICAGAWSGRLLGGLPVTVPIQGGKGYHVDVEARDDDVEQPTYFPEQRVVATPLGDRLRLTGMLHLVGTDMRVDPRGVAAVHDGVAGALRGVAGRRVLATWRGLRPCTPDGLPVVGAVAGAEDVVLATGHGMWGLQLSPVTGRLVGDLLCDGRRDPLLDALHPERFRLAGWWAGAARG